MTQESAKEIENEAARWVMRLDRFGRTAELLADMEAWAGDDRRRRGALLQAEAAWLSVGKALGGAKTDDFEVCENGPDNSDIDDHVEPQFFSRRLLLGAGGGAIAASLMGGFFFVASTSQYDTAVGEIRRLPLADGSVVSINTNSNVAVALKTAERRVQLVRGEAWFQVMKDRSRPFVVEAGPVRALAVGTAFSVRRRDNGADILVTEGVVEVWVDGAEGHRVRLRAGEQAFVADNAAIFEKPVEPSEVDRALAWRAGKIDLAGETLAEAVSEFNRYNRRKIEISDMALASKRFYGIFRVDDPEGFSRAVRQSLDVPVSTEDPAVIRIGRPLEK